MTVPAQPRVVRARIGLRAPAVTLPLIDQGLISLGAFLLNVLVARALPLAEFGRFALILGIATLMQAGFASLVFYPMSVRGAASDTDRRRRLIASSCAAVLVGCVPLSALLAATTCMLVDGSVLLPTTAMLAARQMQECARRGLLTEFRHAAALPGDALAYLGPPAVWFVAFRHGGATVGAALWVMAATSLAAAALQLRQLRLSGVRLLPTVPLLVDFWSLGHWSLTSSYLAILRGQGLVWLLAASSGPAAVGTYQLASTLANVINPVFVGVCNYVPQAASRALRGGHRAAWAASWPAIASGSLVVAGFVAVLLWAPVDAASLAYGRGSDPSHLAELIRVMALGALFNYGGSAACAYLHGVSAGREALVSDAISTAVLVAAGPPLVIAFGLTGAAAALAVSFVVRAAALGRCVHGLCSCSRLDGAELAASQDNREEIRA